MNIQRVERTWRTLKALHEISFEEDTNLFDPRTHEIRIDTRNTLETYTSVYSM